VLELATQNLIRITDDPAIDTEPEWAADGRSLYFTSDRAGSPQIYQIGVAAGARPKRVTFGGAYSARPRVSADGTQLDAWLLTRRENGLADIGPALFG